MKRFLGLACFMLDRVTKMWALRYAMTPYTINSWCCMEFVLNKGISWSIGATLSPIGLKLISAGVTILTVAVVMQVVMYHRNALSYPLILIMSGAVGNVVDRWLYSGVIDFIVLHYGGWYFPTFNIADMAICGGALWWMIQETQPGSKLT